jgi:outer membrane murein-binding lipoprotein Lpp
MRFLGVIAICAVVAGCGSHRQMDQEAAVASELDGVNENLAQCRNTYPDEIAQAVARTACVNKATELLRTMLPFPDLINQENALRKSLAEQVQTSKLSLLERNRQMSKFHSKMLAEEQSRLLTNPSAVANVFSAAASQWRLSNPDSCTMLGGNTANCY